MLKLVRVVAAWLEQGEQVLIAQRASPPAWAGWWELPGGKVEDGESDEAALVRELAEELGVHAVVGAPLVTIFHDEPFRRALSADVLSINALSPDALPMNEQTRDLSYLEQPARRIAISVYRARIASGELQAREHLALAWVSHSAMATYRLLPGDLEVLRIVAAAKTLDES